MTREESATDPTIQRLLEQVQSGELAVADAQLQVATLMQASTRNGPQAPTVTLEHTTIDLDREQRTGSPEVIFGQNKTPEQITDIAAAMLDAGQNVLATRLDAAKLERIQALFPHANLHPIANVATILTTPSLAPTNQTGSDMGICIVSAGTSDQFVAEEAALTAEFYGDEVIRVRDVGVAGLHRLLARLDDINRARVVIVVAGMEGALPSVLGGLISKPMIAVPTSVGYGASFGGLSALLGMLNSCAAGISVVNIDNGFGAAVLAHRINQL